MPRQASDPPEFFGQVMARENDLPFQRGTHVESQIERESEGRILDAWSQY